MKDKNWYSQKTISEANRTQGRQIAISTTEGIDFIPIKNNNNTNLSEPQQNSSAWIIKAFWLAKF